MVSTGVTCEPMPKLTGKCGALLPGMPAALWVIDHIARSRGRDAGDLHDRRLGAVGDHRNLIGSRLPWKFTENLLCAVDDRRDVGGLAVAQRRANDENIAILDHEVGERRIEACYPIGERGVGRNGRRGDGVRAGAAGVVGFKAAERLSEGEAAAGVAPGFRMLSWRCAVPQARYPALRTPCLQEVEREAAAVRHRADARGRLIRDSRTDEHRDHAGGHDEGQVIATMSSTMENPRARLIAPSPR